MTRKEKALAVILDELGNFPPDSTIEPIDGGALVIHFPDGRTADVLVFIREEDQVS